MNKQDSSAASTWQTSDLPLSAFLETQLGQAAQVIPPDSPTDTYCLFQFSYCEELQVLVGEWGQSGTVPAMSYSRALANLKRRVSQVRRGGGR